MLKRILITAGALGLLLAAALAALPWFLNTKAFQVYVSQAATHAVGRHVRFASLSVVPFPLPTVKLRGLEVADDPAFRTGSFLTMREGRIGIRVRPLLSGRIELGDLVLEEPTIVVVEDTHGRWNWASLGAPAPGPAGAPRVGGRVGAATAGAVVLSRTRIVDGRIEFSKRGVNATDLTVEKVNLTVTQAAPGAGLRFEGSAVAEPGRVKLVIREASLTPAGSRALAEMALRASVEIEARDVASVHGVLGIAPAVSGAMTGVFDVSGTPTRLVATGVARSERLILAEDRPQCEPRRRQLPLSDLSIPIAYAGTRIESAPFRARVGNGSVTLRLSIALGSPATATLTDIKATGVDLGSVLVDFLCQPGAVTGPMDLVGEATLRLDDPWRTARGAGRVRIGPGRVTGKDLVSLVNEAAALADVASAVSGSERRGSGITPLEFTSITATYTVTGGVVRTDDLLYEGPDLHVAGAGTLGLADGHVNMALTLTQGRNEVKALVSGTPGYLHLVPTGARIQDARGIRIFLDKLFR